WSLQCPPHIPDLHSSPTRRSSDLPTCITPRNRPPPSSSQRRDCWKPTSHRTLRTCTTGRSESPKRTSISRHQSIPASSASASTRSEEHTSELQSRGHLVCRLLLEK